jgi:predicted O-linked N-acetylglucosamine transferase (SPINDLY family)
MVSVRLTGTAMDLAKNFNEALAALNRRDLKQAEEKFRKVLRSDRSHVPALNLLTVVLMNQGRFADAETFVAKAISLNRNSDVSFYNYGLISKELGKHRQAYEQFSEALKLNPNVPDTWNNRGAVCNDLKDYEAALSDFDRAISLNGTHAEAYANRGKSLLLLKRHNEALTAYDQALSIKPGLAESWLGRGNVFAALGRQNDALLAYDKALSIRSDLAQAWAARGNILIDLNRYEEALVDFDRALAVNRNLAVAWRGRGHALANLRRHEEAAQAYEKAKLLEPDLSGVTGARLRAKMQCCDWSEFDSDCSRLIQAIEDDKDAVLPFDCLAVPASLDVRLKCSRSWVARNFPSGSEPLWRGERYAHDKIRIGYVSADFRQHPVAYLAAGIFEDHDRSRFEILGISIGPNDHSEIRARLERSFDRFMDCAALADDLVAERVRAEEIDILVDLNGFTQYARTEIFHRRPAPVQVNYLGFPGTMGAEFMDYIVADPVLIPASHQYGYVEKIACLPHSYLPHDATSRLASERVFERAEFGLPERGFVFCSFNAAYKFNPDLFRSWMRILEAVEGSVLWLSQPNAAACSNLRKEAAAAGIDPNRLVFAQPLPLSADHLARQRLADLFLDTWPYNAHTTAGDALWAGLPVLTRIGETFAGRVAASLLTAVGLPELITESGQQFEGMAIKLATEPSRLAGLRGKLARNRSSAALFDTSLYTRQLENLYQQMHRRLRAGASPEHLHVET